MCRWSEIQQLHWTMRTSEQCSNAVWFLRSRQYGSDEYVREKVLYFMITFSPLVDRRYAGEFISIILAMFIAIVFDF